MLLFTECKEKYINTLRHGQKAADTTCVGYQSQLNHYQRYLQAEGFENVDLEYALSVDALETYQFSLSKRGLRPRSIKGKFDPIRGMVKYLIKRKVLSENPLEQLNFWCSRSGYPPYGLQIGSRRDLGCVSQAA